MMPATIALLIVTAQALAQPIAVQPYTLKTLAGVPPSMGTPPVQATGPDDLAVSADGKDLWVNYQDNSCSSGTCNGGQGDSQVVEYDVASGAVLHNVAIPGHVDGLKIDPTTNDVWATENEDGNPTLAVINHKTGKFALQNSPQTR
jgi:DNA-binding beta-propeller fold protein YncE